MSSKKAWLGIALTGLLTGLVSGCGSSSAIILKDREQIIPHPTNPDMVCMDKGYLAEIFEQLK